ncbi:MAG: hypothetical protein IPP88_09315 [Betaproteobacteria bacterium]|nr:hypothetical protein [Betaproteobacteria bacterium]
MSKQIVDAKAQGSETQSGHGQPEMPLTQVRTAHKCMPVSRANNEGSKQAISLLVDGIEHESIRKLAIAHCHRPELIENRIRQRQWTAKRAVMTPEKPKVHFLGKTYDSHMALWEAYQRDEAYQNKTCCYSTFAAREKAGHPLEICLSAERLHRAATIKVRGELFATYAEVARRYGMKPSRLSRLMKKMAVEAAIDYKEPTNGKYSEKFFVRFPEIAVSIGVFYFAQIDFTEFTRHKIGISRLSGAERLAGVCHDIIAEWRGPLALLYRLEQIMLVEYARLLKRGPDWFDGRTETFFDASVGG